MGIIILQCVWISNHPNTHFKYLTNFNYILKPEKIEKLTNKILVKNKLSLHYHFMYNVQNRLHFYILTTENKI